MDYTTEWALEILTNPNDRFRAELARTESHEILLTGLAKDTNWYVRECVAQNPKTPIDVLASLFGDKFPTVSAAAFRAFSAHLKKLPEEKPVVEVPTAKAEPVAVVLTDAVKKRNILNYIQQELSKIKEQETETKLYINAVHAPLVGKAITHYLSKGYSVKHEIQIDGQAVITFTWPKVVTYWESLRDSWF